MTSSKRTALPVTLLALLIALPFEQVFTGERGEERRGILTPSFLVAGTVCILGYTDLQRTTQILFFHNILCSSYFNSLVMYSFIQLYNAIFLGFFFINDRFFNCRLTVCFT